MDSIGPAVGGLTALFALFGGVWFPVGSGGVMHAVALSLPSYWLVQATRIGIGAQGWSATGWMVVAAWTIGGVVLARWAYRRDTQRA